MSVTLILRGRFVELFIGQTSQAKVIIQAAYGSQRHLGVYTELGLQKDQIYILSRKTSKKEPDNCQVRLVIHNT